MVIVFNSISQRNELKSYQLRNDEQLKISRNLHDGVAQDLAALKFYLQKDDKEKSEYYASQAFNEIRYLIGSMHLDLSDDFDKIIQQVLQTFEANYKIKTNLLIASTQFSSLTQDYQLEFLRILQESLSNIARHANATTVTVKFVDVGDNFKFIISDNGTGFDFDQIKTNAESETKEHFGLINIKERVQLLGGTVEFANVGGATIAITIKNLVH